MADTVSATVNITIDDVSFKFPSVLGTEDEKAIDISKLLAETKYITLDSGYKNTGATTSKITFMDGDKGILRHRGYSIEELAEKSTFLEVAYLLLYSKLPNIQELASFEQKIKENNSLSEDTKKIICAFPILAHPMAILSAAVIGLTATYSDKEQELNIIRLLGQLPSIAGAIYRHQKGLNSIEPDKNLSYAGNFLWMLFGKKPNPVIEKALDQLFVLHADHEQNCSTSTVRIVGSSQASLFASISAGISALWGPLHGGANQAVIEMLEDIEKDMKKNHSKIEDWVSKAKDKNSEFRLMGFGHRVYKNFDQRAKIIKKSADAIFAQLGIHDPALAIAKDLETAALKDSYFVERKLYPNVDFYSGLIYRALGIPTEMFTVLFALGRLPGWMAQWKELLENKEPIGRPRQIYMGEKQRPYNNIENR